MITTLPIFQKCKNILCTFFFEKRLSLRWDDFLKECQPFKYFFFCRKNVQANDHVLSSTCVQIPKKEFPRANLIEVPLFLAQNVLKYDKKFAIWGN